MSLPRLHAAAFAGLTLLLVATTSPPVSTANPTPTPTPKATATTTPPTPTRPVPTATPQTTAAPIPALVPQPTVAPTDPPELRGLWVDAFHDGIKTQQQVDDLLAWARASNFNALFVQVRRRGDAYYLRTGEPRTEDPDLAPGFDSLQYLVQRAHQGPQPLQVHAWLATLAVWNKRDTPPANPNHVFNLHGPNATTGDNWLMLRDDGEAWTGTGSSGTYFLDPGNPDAARYTAGVYLDLLRNYDVDGIHLDLVRYFEGGGDRRWGYNPASVARFDAQYGRDPSSQPDPFDPDWAAWRRDQVTALVRRVYLQTKAIKPRVAVSAAVIAWGNGPTDLAGWQRSAPFSAVFQDWRYWLQEGIVDYVVPMDYYREQTPQSDWLNGWMAWQQANRGSRGVVFGLGTYLNGPDEDAAQILRARAQGALGVALYSYAVATRDGEDDPTGARSDLAARLRSLFARPAPVPALPWLASGITGSLAVDTSGVERALIAVDGPVHRVWQTDGTGFAGGQDLPPGRYILSSADPRLAGSPLGIDIQPGQTTLARLPSAF